MGGQDIAHVGTEGTEGYLYRPLDLILSSTLQIPPAPVNCLLAKLHKHVIYKYNLTPSSIIDVP
jgi:hypothetical protein